MWEEVSRGGLLFVRCKLLAGDSAAVTAALARDVLDRRSSRDPCEETCG
jgi:hypothetical protein